MAGHLAQPAAEFGFSYSVGEVGDDVNDPTALFGVNSEHEASDACVFVSFPENYCVAVDDVALRGGVRLPRTVDIEIAG